MSGHSGPLPHAREDGRPEERWLSAVRVELRRVRAPESLLARIGAMLAVEQALGP